MKQQARYLIALIALIAAAFFAYVSLSDNSIFNVRAAVLSASALLAGILLVQVMRD